MILAPFELHRPASLEEALQLWSSFGGDADFIAGGTDLLQNYKYRLNAKRHLIALDGLDELTGIEPGRIGAMERLNDSLVSHGSHRARDRSASGRRSRSAGRAHR